MASRPLWSGSIAFGLVTIPIQLHRALRDTRPRFRMLHGKDRSPVRFERVCEKEDRPVPWAEIVKGYEHAKGEFVVLTREELEAAALQKTSSLDILDFVSAEEIDDRFFETPYYAVPGKGGDRAYAVLRDALRDSGKTGVGKNMLREVQHLAALEAIGDALVVTLMRFSDELADLDEFSFPPAATGKSREIEMAKSLIAQLSARWTPDKYTDEYQANVMRVIRAKLKGAEARLKGEKTDARQDKVVDLMERLRQSLAGPRTASARAASDGRRASRSVSRAKPRAAASRRKARVA
jgi:DNA end-binding protein Ku